MNLLTQLDINILNFIQNNLTSPFLDKIMTTVTSLGNMGIIWIIMVIIFLSDEKYKKMAKTMIFCMLINAILINIILKPLVNRTRPFDLVQGIKLLVMKPTDPSFPSGHSAISFCSLVVILTMTKSRILKVFATILAILISYSRLYLYVHYPSDVLMGIILGSVISLVSMKVYFSKNYINFKNKLLNKINFKI